MSTKSKARQRQRTRSPRPLPVDCPPSEDTDGEAPAEDELDTFEAALLAIPHDVLSDYLRDVPLDIQRQVAKDFRIPADPRWIRGGLGRLIHGRLKATRPGQKVRFGTLLTAPLRHDTRLHLGERYDDPAGHDIAHLTDELLETHPAPLVRLYFAVEAAAGCAATPLLQSVLSSDPRLAIEDALTPTEDGPAGADAQTATDDTDVPEDDTAESDASVFTALDVLLIRTVVQTHQEIAGAPSRDELRLLIDEVVHLNAERRMSFFHLGFLSAFRS